MNVQEEHIGPGSITCLADFVKRCGAQKVFLVTGHASYENSGARDAVERMIGRVPIERYDDFGPIPLLSDVEKAVLHFNGGAYDLMVAIGGGRVLDMAKAIRVVVAQGKDALMCLRSPSLISQRGVPLIAIPTTAGSGSEATRFAVLYVGKQKESLEHDYVRPDCAIVDPDLTIRLSRRQTAISGLDALCQGIESYWSVRSTDESRAYAQWAIRLALDNLEKAVNNPDISARSCMAEAAHLAGKAINISKTTACHAISYPMTSYYDVPHGLAVALTLPSVLRFNAEARDEDVQDPRGRAYASEAMRGLIGLIGFGSAVEAGDRIGRLMQRIGMPTRLHDLGIHKSDLPLIIENGFSPARMNNNPRRMTASDLDRILTNIL